VHTAGVPPALLCRGGTRSLFFTPTRRSAGPRRLSPRCGQREARLDIARGE
jgi:hypothetical protein